jgi:hypothetical protein
LWTHQVPIALDFARPFNNRIEVVDAKSMKITSLTLHFFESVPLALIFFLKKKKNPQPVASREPVAGAPSFSGIAVIPRLRPQAGVGRAFAT